MWTTRAAALVLAAMTLASCGVLGREYEYEEQLYLESNGSAELVIDSSIPALVALRGLPLDPSPSAHLDRDALKALLVARGCPVTRVPEPWRRHGRRFVQVRVDVTDVRDLSRCALTAWSTYSSLTTDDGGRSVTFRQRVGSATPGDPGAPGWTGGEIVAFRLHLPGRILFQNARRLDNGAPADPDRGNIVTWEETLADRRAGKPVSIDVRMERETILSHTLWLFTGALIAALLTLVAIVAAVTRYGRRVSSRRPV